MQNTYLPLCACFFVKEHIYKFAARAISLKYYKSWEKTGDCVCHVLPEYESSSHGLYFDITCALEEDFLTSRVPITREAIIQNIDLEN